MTALVLMIGLVLSVALVGSWCSGWFDKENKE